MDRCVCLEIIIAKFQEVKVACDFEKPLLAGGGFVVQI
jgi:hypothetical protein